MISFAKTLFTIGLGSKGARGKMSGTIQVDASVFPETIHEQIYAWGLERLLQQSSQSAERTQIAEWQEKNPKKTPPATSAFPFDFDRLETDALKAMEDRVADFAKGDFGSRAVFMSALDKRCKHVAELRVRAAFAQAKKPADAETVARGVALLLDDEKQGAAIREEAQKQLEAERLAAQAPVSDDILAILAA